jgi:preprotein translocase subunit SecA
VPDDQPIESKMVTNAIRSAQTQVEAQNFEIRRDVLKYDDVMNRQRLVIYGERRRVLEGEDIHDQVQHFLTDTVTGYVNAATAEGYPEQWDLDELWRALHLLYPIELTIEDVEDQAGGGRSALSRDVLLQEILADARAAYEAREEELGSDALRELERRVILSVLDRKWREHLYEMDYLRDGIGLRAMAQRDPLIEYQREGYDLFRAMMDSIQEETIGLLFSLEVSVGDEAAAEQDSDEPDLSIAGELGLVRDEIGAEPRSAVPAAARAKAPAVGAQQGHPMADLNAAGLGPRRPDHVQYSAPSETGEATVVEEGAPDEFANVGRNAQCPCGSGKKYKRCHGDPRLRT